MVSRLIRSFKIVKGFTYKSYRYEYQQFEDCICTVALFLFDKDGEEYYVESPGYADNFRDYYCLFEDTPKIEEAIKNGENIYEAMYRLYRSEVSHIED